MYFEEVYELKVYYDHEIGKTRCCAVRKIFRKCSEAHVRRLVAQREDVRRDRLATARMRTHCAHSARCAHMSYATRLF